MELNLESVSTHSVQAGDLYFGRHHKEEKRLRATFPVHASDPRELGGVISCSSTW